MSLVGSRKAKWYDALISPVLTWLYMPLVFGEGAGHLHFNPIKRAVFVTGYVIKTPIYFLTVYSIVDLVFPTTDIHFLSLAMVVIVVSVILEHIFNEYVRLDSRLRYELGRLYIRQRAETIAQRLPKKADAMQKVVVELILIWVVFFGLSGFIFFSR